MQPEEEIGGVDPLEKNKGRRYEREGKRKSSGGKQRQGMNRPSKGTMGIPCATEDPVEESDLKKQKTNVRRCQERNVDGKGSSSPGVRGGGGALVKSLGERDTLEGRG